jgi:16S rRNA C967 or C1407 C5-methylase (RsmB/RsmF family)
MLYVINLVVLGSINNAFWVQMKSIIPANEWDSFMASFEENPPVSIRTNSAKPFEIEMSVLEPVPWEPHAYYLRERPQFTLDPGYHGGAYYVQEAASMGIKMIIDAHVDPSVPLSALDLCAAPGGKSTHLLDLLHPQSILVSNEIVPSRFDALNENLVRWGRHHMIRVLSSPTKIRQCGQLFDLILVDAPCSGEGMMRKDPQAIVHWSIANIEKCFLRQKEILSEAMQMLAPGGLLLYSTCTYNTIENEAIGDWLIETYDLESLTCKAASGWGFSTRTGKSTTAYVAYAHLVKGEGICLQAFRKKGVRPHLKLQSSTTKQNEKTIQTLNPYLSINEGLDMIHISKDKFYLFPIMWNPVYQALIKTIHGALPGICLGQFKGSSWIPDPEFALIANKSHKEPAVSVSLTEARRYLKGEVLEVTDEKMNNGWVLIQYKNLPLGWGKKVGNRINNYYPAKSRIKMSLSNIL